MPASPGAMCEKSMELIGKGSKKASKRNPKGLQVQQEMGPVDGSKPEVWR